MNYVPWPDFRNVREVQKVEEVVKVVSSGSLSKPKKDVSEQIMMNLT